MVKKIGVLLSGCGYFDGAEIHESVITLLAIDRAGARAVCMAPDIDQMHVVNHITSEEMSEKRNVLIESSRIARGNIQDVKKVRAADLDALILPGGYGAAKNLCDFVTKGELCSVDSGVAELVRSVGQEGKPIGVICIAPALMARVAQGTGETLKLTIGNDAGTATALKKMGVEHVDARADEIVIDEAHKLVSSPAYMCARSISEAAEGIEKLVQAVLKMC